MWKVIIWSMYCIITVHQCAFSPLWVIMNGWTTTCLLISLCWGLSYCSFVVLSTTSYEPRFWPTAIFYYHCYTSSCCRLIQLHNCSVHIHLCRDLCWSLTVVITSNARVVRASRVYMCVSHVCKCKLILRLQCDFIAESRFSFLLVGESCLDDWACTPAKGSFGCGSKARRPSSS